MRYRGQAPDFRNRAARRKGLIQNENNKAIVPPAKTVSGGTIYFGSVMKKTQSALTIVGVLAVFSQVVLVQEFLLHGTERRIDHLRVEGHECALLEDY